MAGCTQEAAAPPTTAAKPDPTPSPPPAPVSNTQTWTFDGPGPIPAGVRTAETGGAGHPATWTVRPMPDAPSPPNAFGITRSDNDKSTYNLAIVSDVSVKDTDLSVMVKADGGVLDAGGGPIWRVTDDDNYYIARWNPLESNVRFYVMAGGVRSALAEASITLDTTQWHSLRVIAEGTSMELFVDDMPVLRTEDKTHRVAGAVGLWSKADATTMFDDLSIAPP